MIDRSVQFIDLCTAMASHAVYEDILIVQTIEGPFTDERHEVGKIFWDVGRFNGQSRADIKVDRYSTLWESLHEVTPTKCSVETRDYAMTIVMAIASKVVSLALSVSVTVSVIRTITCTCGTLVESH